MNIAKIIGLGLLLALPAELRAADAATLVAIKKSGGLVLPYPGGEDLWEVEYHLRGRDLTDEGLAKLAALKNVVALNLRDTKITSAGLAHLKGLSKLKRLHLERTAVDDAGMVHLKGLTELEYLNLYGTKVTDKALDELTGLKKLQKLFVWQTEVTDAGVAKLKAAVPAIKIVQGVDLSKIVIAVKDNSPPSDQLKWVAVKGELKPMRSVPGSFTVVTFQNKRSEPVKLFWMDYGGRRKHYHDVAPGKEQKQNTYSDAIWLVTNAKEEPLGYFKATQKEALAVIPK